MNQLRAPFARFGAWFFLHPEQNASIPQAVQVDLRAFLSQRRSTTDVWFFLIRTLVGAGVLVYIGMEALTTYSIPLLPSVFTVGYITANLVVYHLSRRSFQFARWAYLVLDILGIALLHQQLRFTLLLDPNVTTIALFSLLLIGYVQYSDIRLSTVLAITTVVLTVLMLWIELASLLPIAYGASGQPEPSTTKPFHAFLLLSYLGGVSVMTHRLTHRLFAHLLRFSLEQHKRTKAAVASAVERSRRERLEELNELKHNFITVISHELRTPITPLISSLEILKQELTMYPDSFEMLEIARESASRLRRVVMDYTKLAELITLDDEHLLRWNLKLHDLLSVVQEQAEKRPRLLGNFDNLVVCSDPRLLGGAVLALMRRAEMLTPADQSVTVQGYGDANDVVLSIHDPVSFLETKTIEAIDDPFVLSSERAYASPNTGLELILASHSIRRIGGNVQIISNPKAGTTVQCILPGQQPGARWLRNAQLRQELTALGL